MGAAVFVGLVLIAAAITAAIVGLAFYGMYLGLASLAHHYRK